MVFSNSLKTQVDLPVWEWLRFVPVTTTAVSALCTADAGVPRYLYYLVGSTFYSYDTYTDAWQQLASPPTAPTIFVNLKYTSMGGYRGRVLSCPSSTTLQIPACFGNQMIGKTIRIISGTGQGQDRVISAVAEPVKLDSGFLSTATANVLTDATKKWRYNQWSGYQVRITTGGGVTQIRKILYNDPTTLTLSDTNYQPIDPWNNTGFSATAPYTAVAAQASYVIESSVITVPAWTVNPDYTSRFILFTGGIWCFSATAAAPFHSVQYYDLAADAWYARTAPTGLHLTTFAAGTDSTIERLGEIAGAFDTATCTSATNWRVTDTAKTWAVDRYKNYQVRITAGTGIGQRRRIVCNTLDTLEIDRKWDTNPTAGATFSIYGDTEAFLWAGFVNAAMLSYQAEADLLVTSNDYDNGIACNAAATMNGWMPIALTSGVRSTTGISTINATPIVAGTGYKVGDILTVSDGAGGKVYVTGTSGNGVVTSLALCACGSGYTVATHATTGGSGTACTVSVTANTTVVRYLTGMNHFFKVGDVVTISGWTDANFNGAQTILGTDAANYFEVATAAAGTPAASLSNTALLVVDSSKNWDVNEHTGKICQTHLVGVTGVVQSRRITSNTATSLVIAPTITTPLVNGTGRYIILDCKGFGRDEQFREPYRGNEGHASSGGATSIVDSSKTWNGNQWAGYKVRIVAGTGRGYEGTISTNDATTLTVSAIGATPDTTSHYIIMDTFGQCTTGSATVITDTTKNWTASQWINKRVRIIGGTGLGSEAAATASAATTLTVATSPAAVTADSMYQIYSVPAKGAGISLQWAFNPTATDEKGRYCYLSRGGGTTVIDRYDIVTQKFEFGIPRNPQSEAMNTGTMYSYDGADKIYWTNNNSGRLYYLDLATGITHTAGQIPYGMGTALVGNRLEIVSTADSLKYLYVMRHTGQEFWRALVGWW